MGLPRKEAFLLQRNQDLLDEDLLYLIHQGNISASEELFNRYKYYTWRIAYDFNLEHPNTGISIEEYHQAAFSALPKAIKSYSDFKVGFYGYWKVIALNEIIRYFNENSFVAFQEYQNQLSMDSESDLGTLICEEIGEVDRTVSIKLFREEIRIFKEEAIGHFKKEIDKQIINLFLEEYSLREIRTITGQGYRHIQYVVKRFQKLFIEIMKKRNYN